MVMTTMFVVVLVLLLVCVVLSDAVVSASGATSEATVALSVRKGLPDCASVGEEGRVEGREVAVAGPMKAERHGWCAACGAIQLIRAR